MFAAAGIQPLTHRAARPAPGRPRHICHPDVDTESLTRLARLAALVCETAMAGIGLVQDGSLRLAAGLGVGPEALDLLPALQDAGVVAGEPPGSGVARFCAATRLGWRDRTVGVLFVLDDTPRPGGLTARQSEALRLLAEQASAAAGVQNVYEEIFQSAAVDLVLIDVAEGGMIRFEDTNRIHLRNGGFTRESFIGRTPEDVFDAVGAAFARSQYTKVIETGQPVEYEAALPFPSGERVRHSTLTPLLDQTGRVSKILLTSVDMTDARHAEAELRQAQKMQALGQLTSGIAHDFNNLLTAILGSLDLLGGLAEDVIARRRIDTARRAVERGTRLTRQLLTFARRQTINAQLVGIGALIEGMRDMLVLAVGSTVQVSVSLADDLWPVMADHTAIEQVILNLALNARDAMAKGGRLTITADNAAVPADSAEPPGGEYVRITVTDDGHGMPREVAERAFEPFFTTKTGGQGTGLGLSQVYGLVTQFGGTARLHSTEGVGTTVELYLRRAGPRSA